MRDVLTQVIPLHQLTEAAGSSGLTEVNEETALLAGRYRHRLEYRRSQSSLLREDSCSTAKLVFSKPAGYRLSRRAGIDRMDRFALRCFRARKCQNSISGCRGGGLRADSAPNNYQLHIAR